MSVRSFEWDNAEWAIVENRYGKLLTYNLPRFNRGYANLKYQGYITEMIKYGMYEVFIDVGAYIGLFSQIASFHCNKVIAFEAHPFYFGILLTNMRELYNVECRYKFIGLEGGVALIKENIKALIPSNEGRPYNIEVVPLDLEYRPAWRTTLIKLDVEGNELSVLEGSPVLLSREYIHWIIDAHTQHGIKVEDVLSYFPNRKITMISPKVIKVEGLL